MQKATAIIAAGGAGLRMGASTPKQFTELLGVPILIHTIRAFRQVPAITAIIVVVPAEHREHTLALLTRYHFDDHCTVVNGGKLRQDSVRIGLAQVTDDSTLVAVHDGARPLIAPADIQRCLDAAATHGAAIMAVPVKDTLKAVAADTTIRHTVEREGLWQAQTPQVVRAGLLKEAFAKADQDGFVGTDEASLLEHGGWQVSMVEGSETNLKITRPDDLLMAEALLMQKQPSPQMRIGHGFDAHRLVAGRPLILGGMEIPHELGLLGHSDADALTHALCDAILGAIGAGDIGRHFPDSDPQYKGISSITLLAHVAGLAAEKHFRLCNADITVVAQRPKLAPHFPAMQKILAEACRVEPSAINLKASTTEQMGYTGREEGISAHAVVLMASQPA
ncbi:MAG: 2-C-methyl-D-erythritol 4-phosphate cytidylyltransferase [Desulfurivibrionaceae bacterium]|jgi:2-C-methyl-D-erythritol 4-phosphate cytidylyltransferase/2-C-methyl-D-erythritol 2,4-cyclodiphosphate synthase|nr:2-C-methyl-D-erythritol 4-phosphate cytidylyltransferase [Pseudomonadota bacterium]MCG2823643.1 2-C-methyl-D-erythritol 4-phosphate cytidylyltransferase [Desulfobulbaceae bacterium]MDP2002771.1 2-C-methyl-D-erythritol 4-phosphate cytidylyltransferase [Desulfurivibrionaceae bacterium]MDP2758683.1 2-C-methyl-D-erythritol 4-phosphate cytidylyltransferase [Desulfurivibrionaceae bacterium]PKN21901.1 MAG: bifunctional 2-C-methyl-D-erythritol 4-phosphate cytidylyltransferase/2-C-methyl-D-erythritol